MATVHYLVPTAADYYAALQDRCDLAEERRRERFLAVLLIQRMTRGYLIRKHVAFLSRKATIIQCIFRMHRARKLYRIALRQAVRNKHNKYYAAAATRIQAVWRGHASRHKLFWYRAYRLWLAKVCERGQRRVDEAEQYRLRSRADDLRILEREACRWLAFVVFKLHHLLRTYVCAGIYSEPATTELSEFEQLLKAIRYTEYMKRLKRKYDEFVRKHRPHFSNKRLFPVIGEGTDYWYLSLPEMYELTYPLPRSQKADPRHLHTHRGSLHKEPFLWKMVRPPRPEESRGPFKARASTISTPPPGPAPTPAASGDGKPHGDPRFHLYVKHYRPRPDLFDYVDLHINVLLNRKTSIDNIDK